MGKVLILIGTLRGGGAEKQVVTDANGLNDAGHQVTVGFNMDGDLRTYLNPGINTINIEKGWKGRFRLLNLLRKNRFIVIFCHSPWSYNTVFLPALLSSHQWIMFIHGMNLWRKGFYIILFSFVARFAHKVVITSEASRKNRIEREKINPRKIIKLYNSFSVSTDMIGARATGEKSNKLIIGCVARFDGIKQLHLFIELCGMLLKAGFEDFKILLVGKGEFWDDIKKQIRSQGYGQYFELPGFVDHLYEYYHQFDLFVLPSKSEDLSISLLEASSYGIPSIAFDVGGNCEIVVDEQTGWIIPPYDVGKMAGKILVARDNPMLLKSMGKKAADRVAELFSPDLRIAKLSQVIEHQTPNTKDTPMPIPIIYYHSVGIKNPSWAQNFLTLEMPFLEDQLRYIARNYNCITLHDYYEVSIGHLSPVHNPIVITFDDGYLDNWQWAFPLMKKYGLKATIFVSPEFVDPRSIVRPNLEDVWKGKANMDDLKQWGFLSWDEMRIMQDSGVICIESHTMTHTKYPISDNIIGFHNPGEANLYTIWNLFPEMKPYYINDKCIDDLIPYGYPVFQNTSSVCARRVFINEDFIDHCIEELSDFNFNQYTFPDAYRRVKSVYVNLKEQNLLISGIESDEDYLKRLHFEICTSKNTIEDKLKIRVKFLCWPHGDNNAIAHKIAMECGYLATTVGSKQVIPDSSDRIPLRIGLYHSRNNRFLSMLKVRYRIGYFLNRFPFKQVNILYNLLKY